MRRPILTFLLVLSIGSVAAAQPLAALAPAETFLTLGWRPGPPFQGALIRDLEALDWPRVGHTLEALAPFASDPSSENMLKLYGYLLRGGRGGLPQEIRPFADCPEWRALERTQTPLPDPTLEDPFDEALLSVSANPFNPVPTVTATLRVEPASAARFAAIHRALIRCSERGGTEVVRLSEGDVPLTVLGNAGDFPVMLSRAGNLFVVGTNPEVVRGTLRRASGSDEASLAETSFYRQNRALLEGNGIEPNAKRRGAR